MKVVLSHLVPFRVLLKNQSLCQARANAVIISPGVVDIASSAAIFRISFPPSSGSIHFWKKHNSDTPKTLLYGSSKKVDPPKVDAPHHLFQLVPG